MATLRRKLFDFYFTLDLRSLGLYRILLASLLIAELLDRWEHIEAFYTQDGVLPVDGVVKILGDRMPFTIFLSAASVQVVQILFGLGVLCYLLFLVGYRTRLFNVLSLVFFSSLLNRNPLVTSGADDVQILMLVWSVFLPMGSRYSLDAMRRALARGVDLKGHAEPPPEPSSAERCSPSLAAFGIVFQVAWIYLSTALAKYGPSWMDGTAIHYVWNNEQLATPLGGWLADGPLWISQALTHGTLAIEFAVAPLLLLPFFQPWLRRVAIVLLVGLHAGIWATMAIGNFPPVMIATYALLLDGALWARAERTARRAGRRITLYYDDSCGVCTRVCELLAIADRAGRIRFVGRAEAAANPHGLTPELLDATAVAVDDATGERAVRAGAAAWVFRALPLPFQPLRLIALPGLRIISDRAYDLFASRRHRISAWLGLGACGIETPSAGHAAGVGSHPSPAGKLCRGILVNALATILLVTIVADGYTINIAPRFGAAPLRVLPELHAVLSVSHYNQNWKLFAPDPIKDDGWWVVDGTTEDGRSLDPLAGGPTRWEKPTSTALLYDRTWRKYLIVLWFKNFHQYRTYFLQYLARKANREQPEGGRMKRLDFWYVLERTLPPGNPKPFPTRRVLLASYDCTRDADRRPAMGGNMPPGSGN